MPNFEFKKDRVFGHGRNLALNSIVIVGGRPWTQGFRIIMVSSAVWGKAPAARKRLVGSSVTVINLNQNIL